MPILNMVGGGQKGGNIGEPLNLTVTTSGLDATITWEDNEIGTIPPTTFQKSELVRKIGSAPASPSDGTLVVTETVKDTYKTTGYIDQGLTDGETYYYRVFSYSDLGGISYCDAVNVTPSGGGWQPGVNTVGYRPLQNDCKDYSGNGYDGTWNSPSYVKSGTTNNVAYFNGSYIDLSTFRITEDNTTINVWVKSTSTNTWQEIFDANDGSGSSTSVTYFGYNGPGGVSNQYGMQHAQPNSSYGMVYTSGGPFQNQWKNICVVMNTSGIKIYMNGVLQSTSSNLSGRMVGTPYASIGGRIYGNTNFFRGYISEFIWENKNRTDAEILDYYNQTKSSYGL